MALSRWNRVTAAELSIGTLQDLRRYRCSKVLIHPAWEDVVSGSTRRCAQECYTDVYK